MIKVQVQYFAVLREKAGVPGESVETEAKTFAELYEELRTRHNFPLPPHLVRAAVDDAYVDMNDLITDSIEIVFIPPVAGG